MMTIFKKALSSSFQASRPMQINATAITIDFKLTVTSPATVEWYLEFGDDPDAAADWFRELAEEDAGNGAVLTPMVVRTFALNGGGALTNGVWLLDAELTRRHVLARVQIRVSAGAATAEITTPIGIPAQAA